jgi:DNA-binding LacI/PurR family transcriptional regulator
VSLVAWDDSLYTQAVHPPLSAVTRDIVAMGMHAAQALLTSLDEGSATRMGEVTGQLIPRGTTAAPARSTVPTRTRRPRAHQARTTPGGA